MTGEVTKKGPVNAVHQQSLLTQRIYDELACPKYFEENYSFLKSNNALKKEAIVRLMSEGLSVVKPELEHLPRMEVLRLMRSVVKDQMSRKTRTSSDSYGWLPPVDTFNSADYGHKRVKDIMPARKKSDELLVKKDKVHKEGDEEEEE